MATLSLGRVARPILSLIIFSSCFCGMAWAQTSLPSLVADAQEDHTCTEEREIFRNSDDVFQIKNVKIHKNHVVFDLGGYQPNGNRYLSQIYSFDLASSGDAIRIDDGQQMRIWSLEVHDGGIAYTAKDYRLEKEVFKVHPVDGANGFGQQTVLENAVLRGWYLKGAHDFGSGYKYFFFVRRGLPFFVPAQLVVCQLPPLPQSQYWECHEFSDEMNTGPIVWASHAEPMIWNPAAPMFQFMQFANTITHTNQFVIAGPMGVSPVQIGELGQIYDMRDGNEVFVVLNREENRLVDGEEKVFNQLVVAMPDHRMQSFAELTPWKQKDDAKIGIGSISHGPSAFHSNDGKMKVAWTEQLRSPSRIELRIGYMDFRLPQGVVAPSFKVTENVDKVVLDGDWVVYRRMERQLGHRDEVLYARRCWFNE